ncbi:hypothetical protein [Actinomadura rugatobispora]|uniref:Uncharacterized protein n=1 Tax=Actinomadura rugatobispora TaxID=1994 RepID=A0ABW0ZXM0_9ACTN|nr:hypothetical protein GCM10010200_077320 [Actinomadura rugatobispora]
MAVYALRGDYGTISVGARTSIQDGAVALYIGNGRRYAAELKRLD